MITSIHKKNTEVEDVAEVAGIDPSLALAIRKDALEEFIAMVDLPTIQSLSQQVSRYVGDLVGEKHHPQNTGDPAAQALIQTQFDQCALWLEVMRAEVDQRTEDSDAEATTTDSPPIANVA